MATDPNQLLSVLLGTVGQQGNILQNAQQNAYQGQLADQQLALGQQQQQLQAQQISAQAQDAAQQQQYGTDVSQWVASGAGGQGLSNLIAKYPKQWQALQQSWKIRGADVAQGDLRTFGAVYNALDNGSTDVALAELKSRRQAEANAGVDTSELDQHIQQLESGDPTTVNAVKGWARANIAAAAGAQGNADLAKSVGVDVGGDRYKVVPGRGVFDSRSGQYVEGGDPSSTGSGAADGSGGTGTRDTSRLINSDAGGGQVPDSVQNLGQFVSWGKSLNARGAKSSSAGTYQINGSTLAQFAPIALGDNWQSQPFNADTQDKVGEAIFNWAKQQPNPAAALKGRWVSLSQRQAAQLVKGSWDQAKGTIAAGETGGGVGASANAGPSVVSQSRLISMYGKAQAGYRWKPDGSEEPIPGGPKDTSGNNATLDDDTLGAMAQQYLAGDESVFSNLGRGAQGSANVVRLRQAIRQQAKAQGLNGAQIAQQMQTFNAAQKTLNGFDAGKEGAITRSLNVAIDHLDTLQNAAQALQNGNTPIFNKVAQAWSRATGGNAPTNFEATRQIVAGEVAKVIAGGNSALSDRKELADNIRTSASPQQLAGYIAQAKQLLAGQLHGLAQQYQTGTGRNDFASRLSPRTKVALGYGAASQQSGFRILARRPAR